MPPIAAPLGTYTGWNVYRAQPCELCDRDGSLIPFARTKAEREAAGDPRPSLDERYGSRDAYVARVEAAAEALVADRLLLPADAAALCQSREGMRPVLTPVCRGDQGCTLGNSLSTARIIATWAKPTPTTHRIVSALPSSIISSMSRPNLSIARVRSRENRSIA